MALSMENTACDELARLCEVQRQIIGNPHKYSPAR
jgi:hypothetical protein